MIDLPYLFVHTMMDYLYIKMTYIHKKNNTNLKN